MGKNTFFIELNWLKVPYTDKGDLRIREQKVSKINGNVMDSDKYMYVLF
jgi:hypothetical protein